MISVVLAMVILALWGSNAEGQTSLLSTWMHSYIEERALRADSLPRLSQAQLANINSFAVSGIASSGQGGPEQLLATADPSTVQDSAVMAFTPPDEDYIASETRRSEVITYTVQEGDLISFIASDYGVSVNSILWANNLKNADSLSIGQVLRIPPVSGVIYAVRKGDTISSIAKKYGVEQDTIIAFNQLPKDGTLGVDTELIIPGGKPGVAAPAPAKTTAKGTTAKTTVAATKSKKPFSYLPDLGSYFMLPTTGKDWGIIHGRNGVDIANAQGTPILAAADGVITTSDGDGYNGGYGKYIKISHPNGTETLYGHMSKLLVSVGQTVSKGQKIGLMGTTGRSTGPHLHFEVHGARNPLAKY